MQCHSKQNPIKKVFFSILFLFIFTGFIGTKFASAQTLCQFFARTPGNAPIALLVDPPPPIGAAFFQCDQEDPLCYVIGFYSQNIDFRSVCLEPEGMGFVGDDGFVHTRNTYATLCQCSTDLDEVERRICASECFQASRCVDANDILNNYGLDFRGTCDENSPSSHQEVPNLLASSLDSTFGNLTFHSFEIEPGLTRYQIRGVIHFKGQHVNGQSCVMTSKWDETSEYETFTGGADDFNHEIFTTCPLMD